MSSSIPPVVQSEIHLPVSINTRSGVSATTWLVRDSQSPSQEALSYLAMKILTVESTEMHQAGKTKELEFLGELRDMGVDRRFLPLMYDDFLETSLFGSHLCIVMCLYCDSVSALPRSSPMKAFPSDTARPIIRMLVEVLAQIARAKIIHTDVKLSNLLFGNFYNEQGLEAYLESHPGDEVSDHKTLGRRSRIIKEQPIPRLKDEEIVIYLIDFGRAQRAGEQPTAHSFGALALRAPEVILWSDFGPAVDIWAVGCLVNILLVVRWLFDPEPDEELSIEDDHLAKMIELLSERFPKSMLARAKHRDRYFSGDGAFGVSVIATAADFIRACLQLSYNDRATAEELQRHPFISLV
ncbi:kinase-like domain-containing protein [Mycena rebaudengoi]|nr:kinase-like domain-containing protein [Mycena rebaudengoi]